MTKTVLAVVVVLGIAGTAGAERRTNSIATPCVDFKSDIAPRCPPRLHAAVQADVGLSVVYLGYEAPIAGHVAIAFTGGIFGTYFLPWFDAGDDVKGLGLGVRATWFARTSGKGLYVAPYVRGVAVQGELADATARGFGMTTGVFVGYALRLTRQLDLRVGGGAQYLKFHIASDVTRSNTSTPFVALDAVVAYRL